MLKKRKSLIIPIVFMLISVATLLKLGWWQWEQKTRKEDLIARIESRANANPRAVNIAELARSSASIDELDYTPISLTGRFLHEFEVATFTNRQEGTAKYAGPGYDILTLFAGKEGGILLVNRGFVPQNLRPASTRLQGQSSEEITLTGLIRKPERRSYIDVPDLLERSEFAIRDPKAIIAAKLSNEFKQQYAPIIDSFYVDLRSPAPKGELPSPNKTSVNIPNKHLEYVITWWGLALVFIAMFGVFVAQHFKRDP
jgi:surfeit locus 1 family protein